MENDDRQVGQLLNRREALILLGAAGASLIAGCSKGETASAASTTPQTGAASTLTSTSTAAIPGCVVRPQETAGPYYVDEKLNRSDIRSDPSDGSVKAGLPLELTFNISKVAKSSCAPLAGAIVDVWHCDAQGVYSDVNDQSGYFDSRGKKFLRGYQITDASGRATFKTIYPGWYQGRAIHIHFTIRNNSSSGSGHEFTSQIYFDDALNDRVVAQPPYTKAGKKMKNEADGIFRENGSQLILALQPADKGYAGTFDIALDMA